MDYCGTNKNDFMCRKEGWGSYSWKIIMMDHLKAMVV
jgi:hypothetical protein